MISVFLKPPSVAFDILYCATHLVHNTYAICLPVSCYVYYSGIASPHGVCSMEHFIQGCSLLSSRAYALAKITKMIEQMLFCTILINNTSWNQRLAVLILEA